MAARNITRAVFVGTLLLAMYGCYLKMPEPKPKTPEEIAAAAAADKLLMAFIRCENQTESQLADPEGFDPEPRGQWLVQEMSEDRNVFTFRARARNAFGALIWAEFECTVTHDGKSWSASITQR